MILIIFGRAAQFLLALAVLRVSTTLLSPAEMGKVSLVLTTTAFFALLLINPVGMFINRRLHAWQASGVARHYLLRYVNYLLFVVLVSAISLSTLHITGFVKSGMATSWLIFLAGGSLLFNTINQTAIPSLNLLGDSRRFILLSVATVAASFAFATLFVKILQPSAEYWVLGLLIGQAVIGLFGAKVLFQYLQGYASFALTVAIDIRRMQTLFSFSWPVSIAAGLGWVQGQGYRYLIAGDLGLAELGLFVAGYGISAGMIAGFESILTTYFQPRLYRDANGASSAELAKAWQRYAAALIPSMILSVVIIIILSPELTRIFLGEKFQSAAKFVVWGAVAEAARMLIAIYSLIAHLHMQTRWLMLPNLLGAIFAVTLCAILIPSLGAIGAGIGLVVSGFIVVLSMHILLRKHVDGGTSIQPVLFAILASTMLWAVADISRDLLNTNSWPFLIASLIPVSVVYLILQYLFLRKYIDF